MWTRSATVWARTSPLTSTWFKATATSSFTPIRSNSQHKVVILPEIPPDCLSTNKLLHPFTSSELPDMSGVNESNCFYGLGKALLQFESQFAQIETKCEADQGVDALTFDDVFLPLDAARCQLESVWSAVILLHLTTDALDRDRFTALHKRTERAFLTRHDSKSFHAVLKRFRAEHERAVAAECKDADNGKAAESDVKAVKLDSSQLRILERYLLEYRHQGADLSEAKFTELNVNYIKRLHEARGDYNFRITSATQRFRSTVSDPNVVRDFPLDVLKAMAIDSSQPSKGPWTVTLHPYIYRKFLEYCPDRKLRWNIYQADVSRGSADQTDVFLNVGPKVKDIRQHRQDQAATLGYGSFADMSMDTKMATNVENVHAMIASLLGKAREGQERELSAMQEYAENRGFEEELAPYDVQFFKRKQRRTMLGITDEDLRDFFPLPKVVTGIFGLCQDLFSIRFQEIQKDEVKAWNPDVKLFRVLDESGKVLGHFYFDPYIRNDKAYSGADRAWYVPVRPHSAKSGCLPLGAMVLSLPMPAYGKPSLLNLAEVHELLRNVGNMLLHMLSAAHWAELSGKTGIEWDAMEVASNFMTHWLYTPAVLSSLSGHWSSNEPLSAQLVDALCSTRQHMAGYELSGELFKAAFDIAFYSADTENESFVDIVKRLHPQYLLLPLIKEDSFPTHFSEVLAGEQPASYFSSIWAKMLAADAFSAVQEVGLHDKNAVRKVTKRFRNTFLSLGSSLPAAEIFRQFRGRDPSHEALLMSLGLKEAAKIKRDGVADEVAVETAKKQERQSNP